VQRRMHRLRARRGQPTTPAVPPQAPALTRNVPPHLVELCLHARGICLCLLQLRLEGALPERRLVAMLWAGARGWGWGWGWGWVRSVHCMRAHCLLPLHGACMELAAIRNVAAGGSHATFTCRSPQCLHSPSTLLTFSCCTLSCALCASSTSMLLANATWATFPARWGIACTPPCQGGRVELGWVGQGKARPTSWKGGQGGAKRGRAKAQGKLSLAASLRLPHSPPRQLQDRSAAPWQPPRAPTR